MFCSSAGTFAETDDLVTVITVFESTRFPTIVVGYSHLPPALRTYAIQWFDVGHAEPPPDIIASFMRATTSGLSVRCFGAPGSPVVLSARHAENSSARCSISAQYDSSKPKRRPTRAYSRSAAGAAVSAAPTTNHGHAGTVPSRRWTRYFPSRVPSVYRHSPGIGHTPPVCCSRNSAENHSG